MRLYEIVYIFDAAQDEATVTPKLEQFHELLTGASGAEVVAVDHWGTRQLAYPVDKKKTGYYVVAQVRSAAEALPEFERRLKLDEDVMRYLVVLNEGEPTSGMSIAKPAPPRAADDDEDDDDHRGDQDESEETYHPTGRPPEFSGGRGRRRRMEGPAIQLLNYKDVATLSRFMTEQGKILPKRTTKVTARFQRSLGRAIKRARYLALVPYVRDHEA